MEQLKIGDLVRRDESISCSAQEGVIVRMRGEMIETIRLLSGGTRGVGLADRFQKFYLVSKHPPIKTKFLGGYIE